MRARALKRCATILGLALSFPLMEGPSGAAPYEIPADWSRPDAICARVPDGFAFDSIEQVPGLGVVAYADRLVLRIESGKPWVTLGMATRRGDGHVTHYASMRALGDGRRLWVRSTLRRTATALQRDAETVVFDPEAGRVETFAFPASDRAEAWSVIRLLGDADNRMFAYAGRGRPVSIPPRFDEVWPAIEQRFYRLRSDHWEPLPPLDPATVSATDACVVDGRLVVVGVRFSEDASGGVTRRDGVSARLVDGHWAIEVLENLQVAPAWQTESLACGRSRDSIVVLGTLAGADDSPSRAFLRGPNTLHRFDGERWRRISLPASADGPRGRSRVTALALDRTGAAWIARDLPDSSGASVYRHDSAAWVPHVLPPLAALGERYVSGLAFDEDGTGWAIANRSGDAIDPESCGFLLRFDGDTWQHRGWTWNRLRQRGFGLFGSLR
jgi:hypothetical protein